MANVGKLENLGIFKMGTPENPANRLARGVSAEAATLYFEEAIASDNVILGLRTGKYTELVYLPANSLSADKKSATGVVRGVQPLGTDYAVGDPAYAMAHPQGALVANVISPQLLTMIMQAVRGEIGTGGNRIVVGREQNEHLYYAVKTADGVIDIIRRNTNGAIEWSTDNGVSWNSLGTAGNHGTDANISAHAQVDATADTPAENAILSANAAGKWEARARTDLVDDTAFAASWDGETLTAPSKNAVYDALSEAKTFFDNTDITGAEAETLTAAGEASALHHHSHKAGVDSWAPTAQGQTKAITHNLGRIPKKIKITTFINRGVSDSVEGTYQSIGCYDGANYSTIYFYRGDSSGQSTSYANTNTTHLLVVQTTGSSSTINWKALVSINDINSFTLNVDIFSSAQSVVFLWEVE